MDVKRRHLLQAMAAIPAGGFIGSAMGLAQAPSSPNAQAKGGLLDGLTVDYSRRDHEIVDYQFYTLPDLPGIHLRGPRFDPASQAGYFTCIGAAQTMGVFVEKPYPQLLSEALGIPAWNVGIGGANARFMLDHPKIIEFANRGRFVILQVMAARSEPNDRFAPTPGVEMIRDTQVGDIVSTITGWRRVIDGEPQKLGAYIAQSRAAWAQHYRALLDAIKVPVLLFWFSPKPLAAPIDTSSSSGFGLVDKFPQFVNGEDVAAVRELAEEFAVCSSSRNSGHVLKSRFTGQPIRIQGMSSKNISASDATHNNYYPSPEMHIDAARVLKAKIPGRWIHGR